MTEAILLDMDVLVDFFRGHPQAVELVNACAPRIILPSIVVAQLYTGVKGERELDVLDDFVSLFDVVAISIDIARLGGLYKRDYGRSHGIGLADAILAATADIEAAELKTLNAKHYPMFRGLRPAYMKQDP